MSNRNNEAAAAQDEREANWTNRIRKPEVLAPAIVLLATFAAFAATLGYEFVYDDVGIIVQNPFIQSSQYVSRYFSEHVWSAMYPESPGNYYRPVFLLWLLANHTLFGLNPFWWHLTTLLAHLVVTLLVFFLGRRLTGNQVVGVVAALVFGLHPVHTEAVAWISGLSEPLLAMLLLGAFLCYLKYRDGEADSRRWLAGSILLFTLGAFAKETAIVFPVIVLAYEWLGTSQAKAAPESPVTESRGSSKTLKTAFLRVLPFGLVALAYLAVRFAVLKGFGHTTTPQSFATIVYTWPSVLWAYIKALIWPFGLSPFYETPYVSQPTFGNFFLPLGGLLIVIAGLVWVAKRSAAARVAALWLVLPILPLCNLSVFPEGEIVHDRYLYLPSVGFAILAALALTRIRLGQPTVLRQPSGLVAASAGLALVLGAATLVQQSHWKSNFSLFSFSALVAPNNSIVANNLGNEFVARGEFDQAIGIYQRVLEKDPTFWLANYNLGYSYYKLDRLDEAERYLTRATEIKRGDPDQYAYLGLTQMKAGRLTEAATNIRRAIERKPDAIGYHFALGSVLKKSGDLKGALEQFKAELVNNPRQTAAVQQIADIEARLSNGGNDQVKNLAPASPSR